MWRVEWACLGSGVYATESCSIFFCFFFQAEDGIRDLTVTGVQTCALPISYEHNHNDTFNGFRNIGTSSGSSNSDVYNYNEAVNIVYAVSPTTIVNINYGFGDRKSVV